ncbi:MAG: hypothetical protein FWF54_00180 [Candidatus Azobacteroides sp.]|nr:hypothetical protein [Candidatus Azobacteroides sp.]
MYRYFYLILPFICFCGTLSAFTGFSFSDVRSKGMGEADVASVSFGNPSGLSFAGKRIISLSYENRYEIKELSTIGATMMYPNKLLDVGVRLSRFGYEYYHETSVGASVSRKLVSGFALGIRFDYLNVYVAGSEAKKYFYTVDAGIQWQMDKKLTVGFMVNNPVGASMNTGEKSPVIFRFGIQYLILPNVVAVGEFDQASDKNSRLKTGLEYSPAEHLFFRFGVSGKPFVPTFGIGYLFKSTRFDLSVKNHSTLGLSTAVELAYLF